VPRSETQPIALTIAGSDSGGGAGIQADLKTFAALGVHGTSVVTCITAQNPKRILGIEPCTSRIVERQLEAIFEELPPRAAKTGMLYSAEIIQVVARWFARRKAPLIVDPVLISTSGARLLQPRALRALQTKLLSIATLVTPNLPEAELLAGRRLRSPEDLQAAARIIHDRFGCAALVKGGHLPGNEAIDFYCDDTTQLFFNALAIRRVKTHGTGCTISAAITAFLALGRTLPEAIGLAKGHVTRAIARSVRIGRHTALGHGRRR
jgi:hydroxymethylpyrimidine kinase/phosphomethylpyrimidine kinase